MTIRKLSGPRLSRVTAVPTGAWDGLVVLCAANNYDSIKVADQHLANHLCRLVPVLYIDPPLSVAAMGKHPEHLRSLQGPRLRIIAPGLARLTPIVQPFPSRRAMTGLTSAVVRRILSRATSRLTGRVRAILTAWPQFPVFGSCDEQVRLYWAQDDFVGGASLLGLNATHLARRELRVAADAQVIVAANPVVADAWRERGRDPKLIPYGVEASAYEAVDSVAAPSDVDLPSPIAGVIGQINDRTDLRLLEAVAESGRSLLFVGPVNPAFEPARFDALLRRHNVQWVGPKAFDALPSYLRAIDVGLVPYGDSPFNRGSFPLKTLEYLAAGRAVVATDLPATRWLATDLITIVSDPIAFADAVDGELARTRTPSTIAARRAFAAQHSWGRRAADMVAAIDAAG